MLDATRVVPPGARLTLPPSLVLPGGRDCHAANQSVSQTLMSDVARQHPDLQCLELAPMSWMLEMDA